MKNLYDFPYSLMHTLWCISGLLTRFPIATGQTLLGIYTFIGDNKNIRTRYETCVKLKLKDKYTETTYSNGVVLSFVIFERTFGLVLVSLLLNLNI